MAKASVAFELKKLIEDYLLLYKNISINSLAKKSGIGATTIRRILNDEIKNEPAPHTVLNIMCVLKKENDLSKLISLCDGKIKELLDQYFGVFKSEDIQSTYAPRLNGLLKDSTNYLIYKMASNRSGVSLSLIQDYFGVIGEEKLNKLKDEGIIKIVVDRVYAKNENFSLDLKLAIEHVPSLVSFFKEEEIAKGLNLFTSLSESLSEDGLKRVKEIQKSAISEILKVMKSPYYSGDLPFFFINCMDTLERKNSMESYL